MRKDKRSKNVIKSLAGILLVFMLCILSSGVRARASGEEEGETPTPMPVPTAAPEVTPGITPEVTPEVTPEAAPTEGDTEGSPVPSGPEDEQIGEEEDIDARSTPTPTPFQMSEAVVTLAFESAVYTGYDITQKVVSVVWKNRTLTENADYIVTGSLVKRDVGTYKVSIVGIRDYSGTAQATWSIVEPDPTATPTPTETPEGPTPTPEPPSPTPTEAAPTPIPEQGYKVTGVYGKLYTGSKITQDEMVVKYDGILLALGKDYSVRYKNNINAGVASVVITGKGCYSGSMEVDFTIEPLDISEYCTTQDLFLPVKAGSSEKTPVVRHGTKALKRSRDFDMDILPNEMRDPGTYEVTLSGRGNYTGTMKVNVTLMEGVNVKNLKVSSIRQQEWTGFAITPAVNITYRNQEVTRGVDITYENNIDAGTAYLVITAKAGEAFNNDIYFAGQVKVPFKIKGKGLAGASVKAENVEYTGLPQTPRVTVKLSGEELIEGTDYTVTYKANTKVGTGGVVIDGCGAYSGRIKGAFLILPYSLDNRDVNVELPSRVYYEKGGPIPVPVVTRGSVKLVENRDYTVTYGKNREAGDIFRVVIDGCGAYSGRIIEEVAVVARPISQTISRTDDPVYKRNKITTNELVSPVLIDSNGAVLQPGVDYTVDGIYTDECGDRIALGDYAYMGMRISFTVTGTGNYSGKRVITYRLVSKKINGQKFSVAKQTYTGYAIEPGKADVTSSLNDTQYEIVGYIRNVKTGNATMIVHGLGAYGGYKNVRFNIARYKL